MSQRARCVFFKANRLARSNGRSELAGVGSTSGDGLGLVTGSGTLKLLANLLDGGSASSAVDGSSIAEVGVDANEKLAVGGLDVLDDNVALGALLAVSARAVELTEVGDLEAIDGDGSGSVVLDDLVLSASGTSTRDGGVTIFLQGKSICSNVSMCEVSYEVWWYLPSQTAAHQTFLSVQEPWQWIPSIWSSPMMTLERVAPSAREKTASESPPSA